MNKSTEELRTLLRELRKELKVETTDSKLIPVLVDALRTGWTRKYLSGQVATYINMNDISEGHQKVLYVVLHALEDWCVDHELHPKWFGK